jgi:hypothetical protein
LRKTAATLPKASWLQPETVIGARPTPLNRIYAKPEAALVAHVPPNPAVEMIRSLPLEEKLELLRRLPRGEVADTATASPTVEAFPPPG